MKSRLEQHGCKFQTFKMAAEEDELDDLPSDLVESMENLDRSFEKCQSVLKRLMKVPLLDSKDKVSM